MSSEQVIARLSKAMLLHYLTEFNLERQQCIETDKHHLLFTGTTLSLVSLNGKKSFSVCYKQWQSFSPCPAHSAFICYQNARDLNEHSPRANVLPLIPKLRPASQSKPKRLTWDSGFARFVYVPDSDGTLSACWPVDPIPAEFKQNHCCTLF